MSEERKCEKCGALLTEDQDFCPKCGAEFGVKKCFNCGAKLAEDQDFCSKCGTKYGSKKCPKCGETFEGENKLCCKCLKKKKRTKVLLLIPILLIVLLIVCIFARGMQMVDGDMNRVIELVSNGHYSCFISHSYTDPNCMHGYVCSECGYETGDKTDHNWIAATCTTPKTCSVCGLTEGTSLGHTTRLGVCKNCGEQIEILLDIYVDILSDVNSAIDEMKLSSQYFNAGLPDMADFEFNLTANYIGYAISECGDYPEFAEVKRLLQTAKTGFTNAANASSTNSTISYAQDARDTLYEAGGILVDMGEFLE